MQNVFLILLLTLAVSSCGKKGGGGSDEPSFLNNKEYIHVESTGEDWIVGSAVHFYDDNTFLYMAIAMDNLNDAQPLIYVQYTSGTYVLSGNKINYIITDATCEGSVSSDINVSSPDWNIGLFYELDGEISSAEFSTDLNTDNGDVADDEFTVIVDTGCEWEAFLNN